MRCASASCLRASDRKVRSGFRINPMLKQKDRVALPRSIKVRRSKASIPEIKEGRMTKHQASKGPSQRQLRVGEMIRHAFAEIMMRAEIVDPEFDSHDVTVTEV